MKKYSSINSYWEIPKHTVDIFFGKKSKYCVCIPVINEGNKFIAQLKELQKYTAVIDILILDGDSTDGSTNKKLLKSLGVRALLVKRDKGRLSVQLRMGYAWAIEQGYTGIITIDGNGKDDAGEIPLFIKSLDDGYDYIQGSRFIKNGKAINTPLLRYFAIRCIHAPVLSLSARHWFTDTTNGFRAYSRRYLLHKDVKPFRTLFQRYELLAYLTVRASQLGFKVKEIPVTRKYPKGKVPTKITSISAYIDLLKTLLFVLLHRYDP